MQPFDLKASIPFPGIDANEWIISNLFHSTCNDYSGNQFQHLNPDCTHFIRNATRETITYLDQQLQAYLMYINDLSDALTAVSQGAIDGVVFPTKLPFARISGAPGSGKSTSVFGWIQNQPGGKVFIHSDNRLQKMANMVCIGSAPPPHVNVKGNSLEIATIINHLQSANYTIDILVLDGAFASDMFTRLVKLAREKNWFLVCCTSGQSQNIKPLALSYEFSSGVDPATGIHIPSYVVNGFTKAEYAVASNILPVEFDVSTQALRDERFFYAGGSARHYFRSSDIDEIKSKIDESLREVVDFRNFFYGGLGDAAEQAVNSLITYTNNVITIVSEYATKRLATKVKSEFVTTAKGIMSTNPSWQGWVTKLDFLNRFKICEKDSLEWELRCEEEGLSKRQLHMGINHYVEYSSVQELAILRPVHAVINSEPTITLVFVPTMWNNWGFDAALVFFVKESVKRKVHITPHIHIFQCTIAETHSKLLDTFVDLLTILFPLTNNNIYAQVDQQGFDMPIIHYSVVTRKINFKRFKMKPEATSGVEDIRRWYNKFDLSKDAKKFYFDADCAYSSVETK